MAENDIFAASYQQLWGIEASYYTCHSDEVTDHETFDNRHLVDVHDISVLFDL